MTHPHTDDRHPFWQVAAIFDPEGTGADFSYTVGLHEKGVPELWLAARPSLGDDPGADWRLSLSDTGRILNELSWEWLSGSLAVGDTFERTYDAGLTRIEFQVDGPDDRERLEAFQTHDEASVVPVRWSLHRPPPGTNEPMTADAIAAADEDYGYLTEAIDVTAAEPAGWELPTLPEWSTEQRFGPRHPLVVARAAWLWSADGDDALGVLSTMLEVNDYLKLTWPMTAIQAVARAAGRSAALEASQAAAAELVETMMPDWFDALDAALDLSDETAAARVVEMFVELAELTLGAEVVADLLPLDHRLAALGVLASARVPAGAPPGRDWLASDEVRAAVDQVVRTLGPTGVVDVSRIHASAAAEDYVAMVSRLRAMNATSACCWYPITEVFTDAFLTELEEARLAAPEVDGIYIQEWCGLVAAAISHRLELDAGQVEAFTAPYDAVVPQLRELLNNPL